MDNIFSALIAEIERRLTHGEDASVLVELKKYVTEMAFVLMDGTQRNQRAVEEFYNDCGEQWPTFTVLVTPLSMWQAPSNAADFWSRININPIIFIDEADNAHLRETKPDQPTESKWKQAFKNLPQKDLALAKLEKCALHRVYVSATQDTTIAHLWSNHMAVQAHLGDHQRMQAQGDETGLGLALEPCCRAAAGTVDELTVDSMSKRGGLVLKPIRDMFRDMHTASRAGMPNQLLWWAQCAQHRKGKDHPQKHRCDMWESVDGFDADVVCIAWVSSPCAHLPQISDLVITHEPLCAATHSDSST